VGLSKVFVANRGEIAVRIIRACRQLGIESVLGVSERDRDSLGARLADETVCLGPPASADSYLSIDTVIAAALGSGADAVHPGYGFLAERAAFARACEAAGLVFIGPSAQTIHDMGDKLRAREIAIRAGVPVVPGSADLRTTAEALEAAETIGYPVLLKASAGGGGRGIRMVASPGEMISALDLSRAEVQQAFGDSSVYLERYVASARHIEIQVLADGRGNAISLGQRDCSVQRRFQKMIEEAPATLRTMDPATASAMLTGMAQAALRLVHEISYLNAGTVEFIVDQDSGDYYFLEMNTRVQVEHPVTEEVTGVDIVVEQLRIAGGAPLRHTQADVVVRGHAIECRVTAEDASRGFLPSPGRIDEWLPPGGPGVRIDSHCFTGYEVPADYDSLLAKVIVRGANREDAIARMRNALTELRLAGIASTAEFLRDLMGRQDFVEGRYDTRMVERMTEQTIEGARRH
jgi:acetyl-CoA carboxylase biotin carboxylase subunit